MYMYIIQVFLRSKKWNLLYSVNIYETVSVSFRPLRSFYTDIYLSFFAQSLSNCLSIDYSRQNYYSRDWVNILYA